MDAGIPPEAWQHRPAIVRSAQFYFGLSAPVPVIAGQMMQESGFNPAARSRTGAAGLMQFMPSTASWAGDVLGETAAPLNPAWAIRAGVWYDRFLYDRVTYTNECDRWGATLSAYNGGLKWHNKRQGLAINPDDFWGSVRTINPGITPESQRENEGYPVKIIFRWQERFSEWGRSVCLQPTK